MYEIHVRYSMKNEKTPCAEMTVSAPDEKLRYILKTYESGACNASLAVLGDSWTSVQEQVDAIVKMARDVVGRRRLLQEATPAQKVYVL